MRWIVGVLLAGIAVAASFALDDQVVRLVEVPITSGQANAALAASRFWGEGVTLVVLVLGAVSLQPRRWKAPVFALLVAVACGGIVDQAKFLTGRRRPIEAQGEPARASWERKEGSGRNSSFPSGHAATAFAFGRGLSLLYPPLTPVCLFAGSATAVSRIYERRHYLSDTVVGGLFGWFGAAAAWKGAGLASRKVRSRVRADLKLVA